MFFSEGSDSPGQSSNQVAVPHRTIIVAVTLTDLRVVRVPDVVRMMVVVNLVASSSTSIYFEHSAESRADPACTHIVGLRMKPLAPMPRI